MSEPMEQGRPETGEWETAHPLPLLGVGVDWEIYNDERPMRAVGYIGHREVAEVKAGGRKMLGLKMAVAALPHRRTPQDTPNIKAAPSPGEGVVSSKRRIEHNVDPSTRNPSWPT